MKTLYQHIATRLKTLRQEKGWSLDKTAEKTGVSKAMLGQIEREESSPTIATLWKIASGFEASFSDFLEDSPFPSPSPILRSGSPEQLHPADDKIRVKSLFPFDPELRFEVFLIELLPGCEHLSPPHQKGVIEHVMVIEGEMEVLVNGQWQILKKDEGLRFEAHQPHGYRNLSTVVARFHDGIHYPVGAIKNVGKVTILFPVEDPWGAMIDSVHKFSDDFMNIRNQPDQQEREDLF
jgi:XRE family transcriptional regulator, regulator of sulfur utilization